MASDRSLAEQKRAQQSITILVMDDDANLCHLICLLLTQYRFTALHALSAEEALQVSARHTGRIDLLLADIAMAGTSGPQLSQEIRATQPNVRLLYVEPRDRKNFQGVLDGSFIRKPFSRTGLIHKIEAILQPDNRQSYVSLTTASLTPGSVRAIMTGPCLIGGQTQERHSQHTT